MERRLDTLGFALGAILLAACGPELHPLTEGIVVRNARSTSVYVDSRCGDFRLELFRDDGSGNLQRIRHQSTHCGVCSCDEACDCPPCGDCSPEPTKLEGNASFTVVWSGQEFFRERDERCGNPCQRGRAVPGGRYVARLCYSPWHFTSAQVVERTRNLVCVTRDFDPYVHRKVTLDLTGGAQECEFDDQCAEGEMCNLSTTLRSPDGSLASGMNGEGLCRKRCTPSCPIGFACEEVEILRDGVARVEPLCLPRGPIRLDAPLPL